MSQMCKNLTGNVVKQGGKNKFYANFLTSALHDAPGQPWHGQSQMCGNCQGVEELSCGPFSCVWEMHIQEMVRADSLVHKTSSSLVLTGVLIAAGSRCWE